MIGTVWEPSRNRPDLRPLPGKALVLVSALSLIKILIKRECALHLTRCGAPAGFLFSIIKGGSAPLALAPLLDCFPVPGPAPGSRSQALESPIAKEPESQKRRVDIVEDFIMGTLVAG